jgi:hypothetical protein
VTDTVAVALFAATPPTLVAVAALVQAIRTHKAVNSRMDELLALTRKQATEEATLAEKGAQKGRDIVAAVAKQRHDSKP